MERFNKKYVICYMITAWLAMSSVHAESNPKFSIVPVTNNEVTIAVNNSATVQYRITNNTKITRTLTRKAVAGITQVTRGNNGCTNPFTLAAQQSCILTLQINGTIMAGTAQPVIIVGPVICKTQLDGSHLPDPFLCSQPAQANLLRINVISSDRLAVLRITNSPLTLVTNGAGRSLRVTNTSTEVTATNISSNFSGTALAGKMSETGNTCARLAPGASCTLTFTPGSSTVALSSFTIKGDLTKVANAQLTIKQRLAYISNIGTNSVLRCPVNVNGSLASCVIQTDPTFNQPTGIAFNSQGNIAYIANQNGKTISRCPVNANGGFSTCAISNDATFARPTLNVFNAAGTLLYVTNQGNNKVSYCPVKADGSLAPCKAQGMFSSPTGLVFNKLGDRVYIGNLTTNKVSFCQVNLSTGALTSCVQSNAFFSGTAGIALNKQERIAYVNSLNNSTVFRCPLASNGSFITCIAQNDASFNGTAGIVLNAQGKTAYVANLNASTISLCPVKPNGSFANCTVQTDTAFNLPAIIYINDR